MHDKGGEDTPLEGAVFGEVRNSDGGIIVRLTTKLPKNNNQPRGDNKENPEVEDDGIRDEEEVSGGREYERDRGCPCGLSWLRYARVGILRPGSRCI